MRLAALRVFQAAYALGFLALWVAIWPVVLVNRALASYPGYDEEWASLGAPCSTRHECTAGRAGHREAFLAYIFFPPWVWAL